MEVVSLNTNKQKVAIIDSYKSFIWNDRYEDLGDFELYIPADAVELLANIHQDYYIQCSESDRTMIVEKVDYTTDLEDGSFVTIAGHSLEAILKRRIIWNDDGSITQINLTKILDYESEEADTGSDFPVWMAIQHLLNLYIIDPESYDNKPQRQIPDFVFVEPDEDDPIYSIMMSPCSYQGDNLYDVIKSLADTYEFSFKLILNNDDQKMYFSLYKGVSHLASQTENPYVCFSNEFDNLLSSDSSIDMSTYKNMAYYKGQGSKYVVKEFSDKEITMETGYVRIYNNKVWAVNTDYGQNEDKVDEDNNKVLDWSPDEFNVDYDAENYPSDPYRNTYKKDDVVSRTEYIGAMLTEDKKYYMSTEPETAPGSEVDYVAILLYDSSYDAEERYYKCKQNNTKGDWDPTKWDRIGIRACWGNPEFAYKQFTNKHYKVGDVVRTGNPVEFWECIKEHTSHGQFVSAYWIPVVTHNVMEQYYVDVSGGGNVKHKLWSECPDWVWGTQYKVGNFVTFNDASRTGKITIYRKTADDAKYNSKNKYAKDAVVWYKPKNKENRMYVRKNYKAGQKNGMPPTNTKYWKKLDDKYKTFNAQQWEALDDIEVEQYDIYGSVQNENVGGMDRREMFVDATSVPSSYNYFYDNKKQETVDWLVDDGVMNSTIKDMALAELTTKSNRMTKKFDAEIGYDTNFKYRKDYNIGDIVEVHDEYGYYDSVRVKEFIVSNDDSGVKCYPVFESVEASTITTRLLEVNDELLGNTFLVKIPEATRFTKTQLIATAKKDNTTYYLKSFVKKVKVKSEVGLEKGVFIKRSLHMVAWVTTADSDIYTHYEEQDARDILKEHPTVIGEPLLYIDVDDGTKMVLPGVLFPSWSPPYGTDLGLITSINTNAGQYKNILLANI